MNEIEVVYNTLENKGLQLYGGLLLEDHGATIALCNEDAPDHDSYVMHTAYTAEEMLEYLRQENLTEII